jgi:hypothetical protein
MRGKSKQVAAKEARQLIQCWRKKIRAASAGIEINTNFGNVFLRLCRAAVRRA